MFSRQGILKTIAEKILGLDSTGIPKDQMDAIRELLSKHEFNIDSVDSTKLMKELKRKHLVDLICVTEKNGSVVASSADGDSVREAITGTALWSYVASEIKGSETILVKAKDWFMLMPQKEKIYIVRASANLSTIELKALVKEVENTIQKRAN